MAEAVNGKIPINFPLGDRLIDGAVVQPLTFQSFAGIVNDAQTLRAPASWEARLKRLRLQRQVKYFINGTTIPLTVEEVLQLPIPVARALIDRLDDNEAPPGKVIRSGDGVNQAITYQLGTAISTGAGKEPITELEFLAKTYGDVEDVMAADNPVQQTALLLSTVAKPLGSSLMVLPSWALSLITVPDGVTVMREILPLFLGQPVESLTE